MADMRSREDLLGLVHRQLVHRDFAMRFAPVGNDGSRPIVVALREDTLADLFRSVRAADGAANVVVPLLDGLMVFTMHAKERRRRKATAPSDVSDLSDDCTVGLLVQRLIDDGGEARYRICKTDVSNTGGNGSATAESPRLLAIA